MRKFLHGVSNGTKHVANRLDFLVKFGVKILGILYICAVLLGFTMLIGIINLILNLLQ